MKNLKQIFSAFLLMFSTCVFSQDVTPELITPKKHEITGGLSLGGNYGGLSSLVEYRHYFKKNLAVSLGIQSNKNTETRFHVGFEYYAPISNKVSFYTGLRKYYVRSNPYGSSRDFFTSQRDIEYGAPFGLKYDINENYVFRFETEINNDGLRFLSHDSTKSLKLKFGYKF